MSHVSVKKTVRGEPLITSLAACKLAAKNLGLVAEERAHYRWFGRHVGDWDIPEGMTKEELGNNAALVLAVPEPLAGELARRHGRAPYELAVVPDPNNPGAYTLLYDFYGGGGRGLAEVIGEPILTRGRQAEVDVYAPIFLQHYRMCLDMLTAQAAGDQIRFEQQPDGSYVSYTEADPARLTQR